MAPNGWLGRVDSPAPRRNADRTRACLSWTRQGIVIVLVLNMLSRQRIPTTTGFRRLTINLGSDGVARSPVGVHARTKATLR